VQAESTKEHAWLQQLVGEWNMDGECSMGPGQPPMKSTGVESVRMLGGLWTIGEGRGKTPDGGLMTSIMTLGYDPRKARFTGTFIASMMTHLWVYDGVLDADGKALTLDTEGPSFSGDGSIAKYQDIIEFRNEDHRVLSSRFLNDEGTWHPFMTAHYRRKA
jgi:hypothetical protein